MNLLDFFKEYLITRDSAPSKATVKNYLSDVRKFILWFEMTHHTRFNPQAVRPSMIAKYREDKLARIKRGHSVMGGMSANSVERYTSSLRKFFSCLKENGLISTSPFDLPNEADTSVSEDKWHIKAFKNSLILAKTSDLTIKNYIIDIRQFLSWAEEVTKSEKNSYIVDRRNIFEKITPELTEEYKHRLLHHIKLSPVSINRKLSSLRKYLSWASDQGLLTSKPMISGNLSDNKDLATKPSIDDQSISESFVNNSIFTEPGENMPREKSYSRFPPLRLFQKLGSVGSVLLDLSVIIPLAFLAEKAGYAKWAITGQKIFVNKASALSNEAIKTAFEAIPVDPLGKIVGAAPNFKKSFYAPLSISTESMPLHKKVMHTLRYSRPKWYKRYHNYTFVHYLHFALLIIFMSAVGTYLYRSYFATPQPQSDVLAANVSPPRILSFQGRLTDNNDTPITAKTNLRFGIYNSQTASGSALLWQEVDSVTPDENGIFSIILGGGTPIPQSLFGQNAALFIGISVGADAELIPRQQIATVAYATNSELLQGMPAITQPNAGTANVVLALDSSGNLTIGGTASPTFQATGGTFTLSGNTLNLTTSGNGNVVIAPGGTGSISMQSPITNLGNNNTMPGISGAVQFNDNIGIYNTGVQSAIAIYQTSSGNVITASQSGNTVFSVNNSGQGYFAQALGVGQQNPSSMLFVTSGGDATTATFNSSASTNTIFSFQNNGNQFASLNRNSNGDTQLNTNNTNNIILMPGGNVGLGTTSPGSFDVQIDGHVGPNTDNTYNLGSSSMRWANVYGVNIITQNLTIPGLTNAGGVLYTNASGVIGQTNTGTTGDCLISQGTSAPSWSPCAAASGSIWTIGNGAIMPIYQSADLLIGGNSTASAKFAVLNVASGTPVAYVNGNLGIGTTTPAANADIVGTVRASGLITANGGIALGSGQTIAIGGDTIEDFVGSGLQMNGTTLETTLGTAIDLTSEVTGVLPIANGGTNSTATPNAGGLAYGTGSAYAFTSAGSAGQVLVSNGSGAPTWADASSVGNYWQLNNGALSPANTTNDILLGSNATSSALIKFAGTSGGNSYFNTGGNIGIGTSTPGSKLMVSGATDGAIKVVNTSTGNSEISLYDTTDGGYTLFSQDNVLRIGKVNTSGNWTGNLIAVESSGNMGIGVTSVTAGNKLEVAGNQLISGTTPKLTIGDGGAEDDMLVFDGGTLDYHIGYDQTDALFKLGIGAAPGAGTIANMNLGGNFGIGVTSPQAQLHVSRQLNDFAATGKALAIFNQTESQDILAASSSGTPRFAITNAGGIRLGSNEGSSGECLLSGGAGLAASWGTCGTSSQWTTNGSSIYYTTGNVGIGITNPAFELAVGGTTPSIMIGDGGAEDTALLFDGNAQNYHIGIDDTNDTLEIGLGNSLGTSNFININSSGNVGVGTTSPTSRFHIAQDAGNIGEGLQISNTPFGGEVYIFANGSSPNMGHVRFGDATGWRLNFGSGDNMYITDTGSVVVSGGNFQDSSMGATGSTNVCISGAGVFGTCTSDRRLKENIEYITQQEGLAAIRQLRPARFDFINKDMGENEIGFIAQEVMGVVPEAVKIGKDGYYTFTATALVPHLTLAVQDLDKQVQALSASLPNTQMDDSGNIAIAKQPGGSYVMKKDNRIIDTMAVYAKAIIGELEVGALRASEVSAESLTIAGMSLRDYILSVVQSTNNVPAVVSPLDGKLAVHVISPLASDADIELGFKKDTIVVTDKSGNVAASIDNKGNATFSGTLQTNEASVAGTLTAGKVQTDELDLSDDGLAKLKDKLGTNSATIVNNITNVYQQATPSATPTVSLTPTPSSSDSGTNNPPTITAQTDYADISSMSGILAYVPSLRAEFATFTKGLMSFGPTSLSDTSVTGDLTVNGNMILAENSINVLGADLQIQPLRQGNVSFMSGLVKIDIDGNMSVEGNATFSKKVAIRGFLETNFISPIPGENLVINLPTVDGTDRSSSFVISDASGSAKFRVNSLGDVIASGSGQFRNLTTDAFKIIRGAQADTSITETVATASAGTAIIGKNQTERTVYSPFVKEDSLIYITPNSNTEGLTPYIARQTAENKDENAKGSFTIQLPDRAPSDIKVNWWIVN